MSDDPATLAIIKKSAHVMLYAHYLPWLQGAKQTPKWRFLYFLLGGLREGEGGGKGGVSSSV